MYRAITPFNEIASLEGDLVGLKRACALVWPRMVRIRYEACHMSEGGANMREDDERLYATAQPDTPAICHGATTARPPQFTRHDEALALT